MSLKVSIIDGLKPDSVSGLGGANEGHIQGFQDDILDITAGGVRDLAGGDALVTQNTPSADMDVLVADGVVYVPNDGYASDDIEETKAWRVVINNEGALTIGSNTSGSTRIDLICVKVDKNITPNEYASNVATLEVVVGTPGAGVPATPAKHYKLAEITVVNGETEITNAEITDRRAQITIQEKVNSFNVREDWPFAGNMNGNAIINGNFDIWQRSTSQAIAAATETFVADRWKNLHNAGGGTLPTITVSRQQLTAGDIHKSFWYHRINVNGAGTSLGSGSLGRLFQLIERGTRFLCGNGKKVTVSFWARSSISSKKIGVSLQQNYGTGGSPSSAETINGGNFTLTSDWTKYTFTFTTNTLVGKTFGTDNNDHLRLAFYAMWGSSLQSEVGASSAETYVGSGNIDIAQVQLNEGDTALDFNPRQIADEWLLCTRYFRKLYGEGDTRTPPSYLSTGSVFGVNISLSSRMRVTPTVTINGARGTDWFVRDSSNNTNVTGNFNYSVSNSTPEHVLVGMSAGTFVAGSSYHFQMVTGSAFFNLDAEL